MKLSSEDLPREEQVLWKALRSLPFPEKKTLWRLIQLSNKDHLCFTNVRTSAMLRLEEKGLIIKNSVYQGREGYSYYIMRNAPHLMKKLQAEAGPPSPELP
ncbi:MAG: hypothetical protein EA344_08345 [Alkalicoccus sp.]|nr:MAG: hypothetical protein EA344_08345 [Alkalicoccus sp.]